MKVGIIGKGKMGLDLFNTLLEYDISIVLICRKEKDIDELKLKTEKNLNKKLKRKLISQEEYDKKIHSYQISTCYEELKDCNFVIETVVEDIDVKHEVLKLVEEAVSDNCIIATNTSSFDVNKVFDGMKNKSKCFGVHFFYPIRIIRTAEINIPDAADEKNVAVTKDFLNQLGRKVLILKHDGKLILSKILATIVSSSFYLYNSGLLTINEINTFTKEDFMMFGSFEIIDSTGLKIIMNCLSNFSSDRYNGIYKPLYDASLDLCDKGFIGGDGNEGFLAADEKELMSTKDLTKDDAESRRKKGLLILKSIFINELAYIINNKLVNVDDFLDTVEETLGLFNNPKRIFDEIGEDIISQTLFDEYKKTNYDIFKIENYDLFKQ